MKRSETAVQLVRQPIIDLMSQDRKFLKFKVVTPVNGGIATQLSLRLRDRIVPLVEMMLKRMPTDSIIGS